MTRTNIILGLLGTLATASFVTACAEEAKAPAPPEKGGTAPATAPPSAPPSANVSRGDEQKLEPMTHTEFNGI
ncbi:MAG: hypothetical protein K2X31_04985, partial [Sphingopyxis sp.]|nr:hypothetical protein [Sphingopyxis sp.]